MIATLRALSGAFAIVPGWAWAAVCSALIATNCTTAYRLERERATAAQAKADQAAAAQAAETQARQREQQAAQTLAAIQQKAAHEKSTLQRRAAALADSLRNRPERPADGGDLPAGAAGPVACTGAQLYRPDGEFLAREAARADQLRIDLDACRSAYDAAVRLTSDRH